MMVTGVVIGCVVMVVEVSSRRKGDVSFGLCNEVTISSFSLVVAASIAAKASTAEDTDDTDDEDSMDDDFSIIAGCSVVSL
mmetsp:Transcript_39460/g.44164  ORF Transcript_39460/g.44164 Transcript_39460/m.44164 type:complete len:81 (-) Transcript_39460:443-685(-)